MKATKKTRIPSLRHCNNRGFVCLNGKRIYLGTWGEQETKDAYERTIAEWLGNKQTPQVSKDLITIAEVYRDYWNHCEEYYRKADGTHTSSLDNVRQACKPLRCNAHLKVDSQIEVYLTSFKRRLFDDEAIYAV